MFITYFACLCLCSWYQLSRILGQSEVSIDRRFWPYNRQVANTLAALAASFHWSDWRIFNVFFVKPSEFPFRTLFFYKTFSQSIIYNIMRPHVLRIQLLKICCCFHLVSMVALSGHVTYLFSPVCLCQSSSSKQGVVKKGLCWNCECHANYS